MIKHIFFFCSFLWCMKIQYDFSFKRLGRMHENKTTFLFFQFFDQDRVF